MTEPAADRWTRCFHPRPAAPCRLVCFPHAGGAASTQHALSAAMPPGVEVVAVQYPGRQDRWREPFAAGIGDLVTGVLEALGDDDRPLALYGHSMGAVVAFETAQALAPAGRLLRLVVSGRVAPSEPHRVRAVDEWDDDRILDELTELGGIERAVFADPELVAMALPPVRADYRILRAHVPSAGAVLPCPVTAMAGTADPSTSVRGTAAWERHTSGAFDLHTFDGGHFFTGEHLSRVAALLAGHLDADIARATTVTGGIR